MGVFFHQGLPSPFTEVPYNPTYVSVGADARLTWNYLIHGSFRRVEIEYMTFGLWATLLWKKEDGSVGKHPNVPKNLRDRITIEGNATLVISAVDTGDSTRYRCAFVALSGPTIRGGLVQLIVTGKNS